MKVAFIGHRTFTETAALKARLANTIEALIINEAADTFYFGSKSKFDELCYEIVTKLRQTYPYIRRIFVRGEYEYIDESYQNYLLTLYEESFFASTAHGAGRVSYIKRNEAVIEACDILVVYYDHAYRPPSANSGTKLAVDYAKRKKKQIINVFES